MQLNVTLTKANKCSKSNISVFRYMYVCMYIKKTMSLLNTDDTRIVLTHFPFIECQRKKLTVANTIRTHNEYVYVLSLFLLLLLLRSFLRTYVRVTTKRKRIRPGII